MTTAAVKSPGGRSKPSRRFASQPTKLEAIDDELGPLGPLGANVPAPVEADQPPELPQKEHTVSRSARPAQSASQAAGGVDDEDDEQFRSPTGARIPPPVQPPSNDGPRRQTQPSMSVEQAAKPSFNIAVGDPHKVGDLTSSHTVYQVRTTVRIYRACCCIFTLTFSPDYFKSVSCSRIHRLPPLSRFPVALQPAPLQQPGCCRPTTTG